MPFDPNTFFEMEAQPEIPDHSLWVERYRPKTLNELVGSPTIKETVEAWLKQKDVPHILLFGPPGTGKTSIAKILLKHIPCDSMMINASDENGVDSIRTKVQDFCVTMGTQPLKIMFLDEADRLTPDAQGILRPIMEIYAETTRFILTCNYQEKILPAIKSRCQSFEVKPPSKGEAMKLVVNILTKENIKYKPEDVAFIVSSYFPDFRKIINFTQQSSITGELKIAKANTADQDFKTKLVELLKTRPAGVFNEIRQLVADASFSNYEEVYKFLFDRVDDYAGTKQAEVILHLADASYQSALVFEREITFVAAMHKLLSVLR